MVGGMIGGRIHYRTNWKWKTMLNMIAYSAKDPMTLTPAQRFQRLYRACVRRQFMLNHLRLKMVSNHYRNYYEQVEKIRAEFEDARKLNETQFDFFVKKYEEWLELTFFPAVSHWPTRLFSNKFSMNVAWPDQFHEFDPAGYYSPRPITRPSPTAGPYFQEYPRAVNTFAYKDLAAGSDPYSYEAWSQRNPEMSGRTRGES